MKKIAVFASGSGTNAENIIRYFERSQAIRVAVVLSNNRNAGVHERVNRLGTPSFVFTREEFEQASPIIDKLAEYEVEFIVLAGFMNKISERLLKAFPNKIINIHPALLPKYGGKGMYGMNVHRAVTDAGEKESGITIHYINERYDEGDVIFQASCPLLPSDTPEELATRIHALEHKHYPRIIEELLLSAPPAAPRIIRLKETTSTNQYLREYIQRERLPEGSVVVAESQTAGRGQQGTYWESAPGENLTFSIVIYPGSAIPASRQFILSQMAALAVKETLEAYVDGVAVKWPNDIYRHDKKICGMLIENSLLGQEIDYSIIGVGLNLNQTLFAGDAPNPVSLRQITGRIYDKDEALNRFLSIFHNYRLMLLQAKEADIAAAYQKALYRGDGFYAYRDASGRFEARIHGVEPTGRLLLQLRSGEIRRYAFKEVSFEI